MARITSEGDTSIRYQMVTADSEEDAIARAEQDLGTMSSHDWGEGTVAFSERSSYLVRHEAPNPARSMFVDA